MGVIGNKGIDVRQSANRLIFRAFLQDSSRNNLPSGTTTIMLGELQDDATIKTYDYLDNTFKATACTTPTANATHRTLNNGTVNSGIWTYLLPTLSGFTKGAIYLTIVTNSFADPPTQVREWQFGGEQGDAATLGADNRVLISTDAQDLSVSLDVNAKKLNGAVPNNLAAGAAMTLTPVYDAAKTANSVAPDNAGIGVISSRLIGTIATGTHYPQSGDSFTRIGSNGSGLTAIWDRLTSSITTPGSIGAWILDKLDVKVSSVSAGSVPTVAQIWNYAWRTLTTNHNQVVVNENTLQCNTCNTFYQPIEDLGSFTNYVALYFTVKQSKKDTDAQAIFQVMKRADSVGDGLLRAFGQVATLSNGSITISDSSLGNIIVEISDTLMAQLQVGTYYADVKIIRSAGIKSEVLRNLVLNVVDTPTKAIS